LQTVN